MKFKTIKNNFLVLVICLFIASNIFAFDGRMPVLIAGDPSLQEWLLPDEIPSPNDNKLTPERIALGKQLFADPRLSGTGQSTCIWCHRPERGWSDALKTGAREGGEIMALATPTIVNIAYNKSFMWDGRAPTLDKQGYGGQKRGSDINAISKVEPEVVIARLNKIKGYTDAFAKAYPNEGLTRVSVGKAIASFERSIVSKNSPFDQWVKGDKVAMSKQQINGFRLFVDRNKGDCAACHVPPNFTDSGFHNIGLAEFAQKDHQQGRYKHRKIKMLDGAFKTPTLRDVSLTAPYMHDGSLSSLKAVVAHYAKGGEVKTNLSPTLNTSKLSDQEQLDIVAFLEALTTEHELFVAPVLPIK